jgi:hypothetical protein
LDCKEERDYEIRIEEWRNRHQRTEAEKKKYDLKDMYATTKKMLMKLKDDAMKTLNNWIMVKVVLD